jgi:hypothetical protein
MAQWFLSSHLSPAAPAMYVAVVVLGFGFWRELDGRFARASIPYKLKFCETSFYLLRYDKKKSLRA